MLKVSTGVESVMYLNPEHISSISRVDLGTCMVVMSNGREYHIRHPLEEMENLCRLSREAQLIRNQSILNKVTP